VSAEYALAAARAVTAPTPPPLPSPPPPTRTTSNHVSGSVAATVLLRVDTVANVGTTEVVDIMIPAPDAALDTISSGDDRATDI
jgi:hypothetical protein